jgi:hypothetical protein
VRYAHPMETVMKKLLLSLAASTALMAGAASPAMANHSWNGYHWARTANPFTVPLGDNLSTSWKDRLGKASTDWSASTVMDTPVVPGGTSGKKCRPTSGRVEVCNASYGRNGWLGLAQIWVNGSHITQGVAKMNDTYFSMAKYNYVTEKQHVICQEVGHTFGLGHQDESGISLNTCMDYYSNTSDTDTQSTSPNQHDYDELATIYAHLDTSSTLASTPATIGQAGDEGAQPYRTVRHDNRHSSRIDEHFSDGTSRSTIIEWAD